MQKSKKSKKSLTAIQIMKVYIRVYNSQLGSVTLSDMTDNGITKGMIEYNFGSMSRLDIMSRSKYPTKFKDLRLDEIINSERKKDKHVEVSKYKRFVVTTVVTGCKVNKSALESVKNYCKIKDAKLLLLTCADPAKRSNYSFGVVDKLVENETIIANDTELNDNLSLSTIKMSAKQIQPLTGLRRFGQRDGSMIFASPKQHMMPVHSSRDNLPRLLLTTGCITESDYDSDRYMSARTSKIAECDHKLGALIVEVKDEKTFYVRQIQFDSKGRFADLGKMYSKNEVKDFGVDHIVFGDIHVKEHHPIVERVHQNMVKRFKPNGVVMHDVFSGISVNHHEQKNKLTLAKLAERGDLDLSSELEAVAEFINNYSNKTNVIIPAANHHDFLVRYLQEFRMKDDPHNARICLELSLAMLDDKDPVQQGVTMMGLKNIDKVRWLKRDEDYIIGGSQLGAHGDKGLNGSKGTLKGLEESYGNIVAAHVHTPGIFHNAWMVGTSTRYRLSYTVGPSSWMHSDCLVYSNGMKQMINTINGEFTTDKKFLNNF